MLEEFTYDEYAALIEKVRRERKNLCFRDFTDLAPGQEPDAFFIVRHDVDLSIEAALEMARREADTGVRASYFVLLSCEYYNLLSAEYGDAARRLVDWGHEVGLHYDVSAIAKRPGDDPVAQLELEAGVLSSLTGQPVRSISMHVPHLRDGDPFAGESRYVNAYDERFTRRMAYYSDSCGAWRDEALEALCGEIPARVQLLVHPFFWQESPGSRWTRLEDWKSKLRDKRARQEQRLRETWNRHAGAREHDERQAGLHADDSRGGRS